MRVLVTGGSGFVGRVVLQELASQGVQVVATSRTAQPSVAGERCCVLPEPRNSSAVEALLRSIEPQVVMHLAGVSTAPSYLNLYEANVVFGANLLDASMAMRNRPRVLIVGSAAEYGPVPDDSQPVREDVACRPNTAYGASKLAQTHHALIAASRGLAVVVARLFNPIGPGMPKSLALGSFAHQIAKMGSYGGQLRTGDLEGIRDFMDVKLAARILVNLSLRDTATSEIVNICTGKGHQLLDLTRRLIALSGIDVELSQDLSRRGNSDVKTFIGDPCRLNALGYSCAGSDFDAILADILRSARAEVAAM